MSHGHVSIGNRKVNIPGYIVKAEEEHQIMIHIEVPGAAQSGGVGIIGCQQYRTIYLCITSAPDTLSKGMEILLQWEVILFPKRGSSNGTCEAYIQTH